MTLPHLRPGILVGALLGIILAFALMLHLMGQVWICKCGEVKVWFGATELTSENSQHISDWYTFSHVIHGFLFFGVLWFFRRWLPLGWRLILATLIEVAWELFENTDFVINRYREYTIAFDYYGDSVINSVADVVAMIVGFLVAWRAPLLVTLGLLLLMEVGVAYLIRDNLTLNIVMLLYPFDFILEWQSAR